MPMQSFGMPANMVLIIYCLLSVAGVVLNCRVNNEIFNVLSLAVF